MKTKLLKLTCGLALLGAAATAPAQSTIDISLTDDGSGNTLISWTVSGDLASGGATAQSSTAGLGGLGGGFYPSFRNIGSYANIIFPVSGGGTLTDLTTSTSAQITGVEFTRYACLLVCDSNLPFTPNGSDVLEYTAGTDSAVIAVPFSSFTSGTVQTISTPFTQPVTYNLTVGAIAPVPEPSTLALAGLGGLGLLWQFRRRK